MKAKELKEIYAKGVKNSTRSAIFDKYKTLFTHYYYWDENEEDIGTVESFQTKDDLYFISHYKGENGEFSDGHYYYKDGFAYWSGDKIEKPGFVFDISDSYKVYQIDLIPDDPEKQKEELDTTGATAYTDGSFVFVTQKGKDKAGAYHRTDMVLTADTGIMVGYSLLRKDKNGKEYVAADCDVELDLDMPDMYESLKREFDRVAKKTVKISYIYDPGTPDEKVLTRDIPEGSCFYFTDVPDGYKLYEDLEGTTPVEPLAPGEFQEEAYEDNTFYLIKDTASAK